MTLAHQGGWDEILLVAGPIVVIAVMLWLANKRAGRLAEDDSANAGRPENGAGTENAAQTGNAGQSEDTPTP